VRAYWTALAPTLKTAFRFLHISTDEVYGSLSATEAPFAETHTYEPNSPYSASKAASDHLVRAWHHTYGLPVFVTHCSNNYGPYQFPEKLIPLMIMNAMDGRDLPVYGDGGNVRDWIYVNDHCLAIYAVLQHGKPGERYNIGASCEKKNMDVVQSICRGLEVALPAQFNNSLKKRGLHSYEQLITFVADRPGHDRRYAIDAEKLRKLSGWKPETSFDEGLLSTIRWYVEHQDWCRSQLKEKYDRSRLGVRSKKFQSA
jgi:dTDP-glucose 4,6-dehydratase